MAASSTSRRTASPSTPSSLPRKRRRPATGSLSLDLGLEAGEAREILAPHQRPVDAGRAHLERVGAGDGIGNVEQRRDGAADLGAIIDRHRLLVDALGHDLQRGAPPAGDGDAYHAVAHRLQRRRDHRLDLAGFHALPLVVAETKKVGPGPTR